MKYQIIIASILIIIALSGCTTSFNNSYSKGDGICDQANGETVLNSPNDCAGLAIDDIQNYIGDNQINPSSINGLPGEPYFQDQDIVQDIIYTPNEDGYYLLDGFGAIHTFGATTIDISNAPYWPSQNPIPKNAEGQLEFNVAKKIQLNKMNIGIYLLDAYGAIHGVGNADPNQLKLATQQFPSWQGQDTARDFKITPSGNGVIILDKLAGITALGDAQKFENCQTNGAAYSYPAPVEAKAIQPFTAPDNAKIYGYWILLEDSTIYSCGGAPKIYKLDCTPYADGKQRKIGDLTGEGVIDNADAQQVLNLFGNIAGVTADQSLSCADMPNFEVTQEGQNYNVTITGPPDGIIDNADSQRILNAFKYVSKITDENGIKNIGRIIGEKSLTGGERKAIHFNIRGTNGPGTKLYGALILDNHGYVHREGFTRLYYNNENKNSPEFGFNIARKITKKDNGYVILDGFGEKQEFQNIEKRYEDPSILIAKAKESIENASNSIKELEGEIK